MKMITMAAVGLSALVGAAAQDYSPPLDMMRPARTSNQLDGSLTRRIMYSWSDPKKMRFSVLERLSPIDPWSYATSCESTSFYVSAVAPLYYDTLYVVGVTSSAANPRTVIEKWELDVVLTTAGTPELSVDRSLVLESTALTHVEGCAISPNGDFLVAKHRETDKVWKISLPSGARSVIATAAQYPNLQYYNQVLWAEHATDGGVFMLIAGRNIQDDPLNSALMIWDDDLDGNPSLIEDLDAAAFLARGFKDLSQWTPEGYFESNSD